jgi:hypothetical protein
MDRGSYGWGAAVTYPDPARAQLQYALAEAERRLDDATRTIVRLLVGGLPWWHEDVRASRAKVQAALVDRSVIERAQIELDIVDGVRT